MYKAGAKFRFCNLSLNPKASNPKPSTLNHLGFMVEGRESTSPGGRFEGVRPTASEI